MSHLNINSQRGRFARTLAMIVVLLSSGTSAIPADEPSIDVGRELLVRNRLLQLRIEQARQAAGREKFERAIALWQGMLDNGHDALYAERKTNGKGADAGFQLYRPLTFSIEAELLNLPKPILKKHRRAIDREMRVLLEASAARGVSSVEQALENAMHHGFISATGADVAYQLACLKFDRGDFSGASRLLWRIRTKHPDSTVHRRPFLERLALAEVLLGDAASARQFVANFGRPSNTLIRRLRARVEKEITASAIRDPLQRAPSDDWKTPLGSSARNEHRPSFLRKAEGSSDPPVGKSLAVAWTIDFSDELFRGGVADEVKPEIEKEQRSHWSQHGWFPTRRILLDKGQLLFRTDHSLAACDTKTGALRWLSATASRFEPTPIPKAVGRRQAAPTTASEIRSFEDQLDRSMAIVGDSVYCLEADLLLGGVPYFIPSAHSGNARLRRNGAQWIAAYQTRTGKLRWRRTLGRQSTRTPHKSGFLAAPVAYRNLLLIPVIDQDGLWLLALDQGSGNTVWRKLLVLEPDTGPSPWRSCGICLDGGDVYVAGGGGLIFALDAQTGRFHWALRYPHDEIDGWNEETLIAHGRWLLAFPSDSRRCFAVDRRDGRLLWDRAADPSTQSWFGRDCLGVMGAGMFVVESDNKQSRIVKYDVRTGSQLWEQSLDRTFGRGFLAADAVYLPLKSSIVRLDLQTGAILSRLTINAPGLQPIGNLCSDGRHLLVIGPTRITALAENASDRPSKEPSANKTLPHAARDWRSLMDDDYTTRVATTHSLTNGGLDSLPLILAAVSSDQAEARSRAFEVLFRLSTSEDTRVRKAVIGHLQRLAISKQARIAQRAARILSWPTDHAVAVLQRRGGRFSERTAHLENAVLTDDDLGHVRRLKFLEELWLTDSTITDGGLKQIAGMTQLTSLGLQGTSVTDAGMVHLAKLNQLEHLYLGQTNITDAGLEHVGRLTSLKQLRLGSTCISDVGLKKLAKLTNLRLLFIERTRITDAGLVHLKDMKRLRHLYMHDNDVSDEGLVQLSKFPELFALSLDNTQVTDDALVHLTGLKIFERLYLSGTGITNKGLLHLKKIRTLSDLNLQGTDITDAGLVHLRDSKRLVRLGLPRRPRGQVTRPAIERLKQAIPNARDVY